MVSSRAKDYVSAILLVLIGTATFIAALSYKIGSLREMGAGFVPTVIGILLVAVGLLIGVTSSPLVTLKQTETSASEASPFEFRAWGFIIAGVASFVILGTYGGFVPASFACVLLSAFADRQNSIRDAALLATVIVAAGYAIFHVGLRLQFDAFAWG
jgi:hypothetical protein